jgi:hypothetical protein
MVVDTGRTRWQLATNEVRVACPREMSRVFTAM